MRTGQIEHLGEILIASATLSGTIKNTLAKKNTSSKDFYILFSCSLQKDGCVWLILWGSWNEPLLYEKLPDRSIMIHELKIFLACGV